MTELQAMDQFDRLIAAGYVQPADPDGKPGIVFREWFDALRNFDGDDVSDGVTKLMAAKMDRFWPTVGELRGVIASLQAGRESVACRRCHGSHWVDARPYRANGDVVYQGVERCPECGVPAPVRQGTSTQTPFTDREYADWRAAQRPERVIQTRAEFMAAVRATMARVGGRVMLAVEVDDVA